jgi:trk system potassium uptake protein TrkH
MRRVLDLPLIVILIALAAPAMLVPAGFALMLGDGGTAAVFGRSALLVGTLAGVLAAATFRYRPENPVRSVFLSLIGAYAVLPPLMALPMAEASPTIGFAAAWFEMVSSLTTTGATLITVPAAVPAPVHLWNAMAGWMGGFFVLLVAAAMLAPLNLGGPEIETPRPVGRLAFADSPIHFTADTGQRLVSNLRMLGPAYCAITLALWVGLQAAGERPFVALCHAMGVISTSGISPVGGLAAGNTGWPGEALLLGGLVFAVTRRSLPGAARTGGRRAFHRDPELRLAIVIVFGLTLLLMLRTAEAAFNGVLPGGSALDALRAAWGAAFTLASFLTTTGYISADWPLIERISGLGTPALLLAGVALIGGGVATTAGGIRLLRVLSLVRHGQHQMQMMLQPSLVSGGGRRARHIRGAGAYLGWVGFMLFISSLAAAVAALTLTGLDFEPALILGIAALSTTGPLAAAAGEPGLSFAALDGAQRVVAGVTMVLGRLELLAVVALLVPEPWRR